jgi:hypothetical protein
MVLGQMAGMAAPLAGFGLAVWGATVFAGRRR